MYVYTALSFIIFVRFIIITECTSVLIRKLDDYTLLKIVLISVFYQDISFLINDENLMQMKYYTEAFYFFDGSLYSVRW